MQLAIEDAVDVVCDTPDIAEAKAGDLAGIRVYKFRFKRQQYLIAYRPAAQELMVEVLVIDFYQVGTHENFYETLKRYLRKEIDRGEKP
ncbi:type II toxin-antitoxin system RelE/ParE family toxin [Desulfobulbus alkaliphilus]|uniref:type II toxin-antitoxin system RelE/ParE family toxin n=1 Tax=Desulfobulbus alkaliphilus TaxID=869814 RepID=UPI001963D4CB|nr:type II toxin-antitoxin system RelE/ParE family toxin [Desulfobulbus alkaliphilus]MBM9535463.1 type II toxin-antitoxin system RelE/ParE family toxin [Desulfobulbus alkaliphilus]